MKTVMMLCALLFPVASALAQESESIYVREGDVAALKEAIEAANAKPVGHRTDLFLSGDFQFSDDLPMPSIETDLSIASFEGTASLRGPAAAGDPSRPPVTLFHVSGNGRLKLFNISLSDLPLSLTGNGLVRNEGSLVLEQVVVSSVSGSVLCLNFGFCVFPQPLFQNLAGGSLTMERVSIVNSGALSAYPFPNPAGGILDNDGQASLSNVQLYLTNQGWTWKAPVSNAGTLAVNNATFFSNAPETAPLPPLLNSGSTGDATIRNSVVSGFDGPSCDEVVSLGFNLHADAGCGWSAQNDIVGTSAGLMWRTVDANWRGAEPQILARALVPSAASPAVDSANPESCSPYDLPGNRRSTLDAQCDRGAVEAIPRTLGEGGINGLYFNPQADGHYVQVMQTDYLTLVIWNTFDLAGNHVWVYGTGQLVDGGSLVAETYINRDGIVVPDTPVIDAETEYWGTLVVEMDSCTQGTIVFNSVFPEFGSGQFPIERLAYIKQIGCAE